jgi:uncharacterized protein YbjT (DUF2867 family)
MDDLTLVAGASGYVGGRLVPLLLASGRRVRCLARRPAELRTRLGEAIDVAEGDVLDPPSLDRALAGVRTAFYLVHSMAAGAHFAEVDRQAARNFALAAARAGVRRIVYLGGLGEDSSDLSPHLRSRHETGEALRSAGVPVTEFRASIVIGTGSLSFEMIRALTERLPVMICPRWVSVPAQPIAIDDVLAYLMASLDLPEDGRSHVFEIGGPDVVSYGDILRVYARLRGLRRCLIPVPLLTPHLSSLWLALVTPLHAGVGRELIEGVRNPTIVRSGDAREAFDIQPMSLDRAVSRAIEDRRRMDQTDAGRPRHRRIVDSRWVVANAPPPAAFTPIRRIGGAQGWYYGDMLWRIRGWLDRLMGGEGLRPGRTHPDTCEVGDRIDCWVVERCEPDRRLRLAAAMKLPGRAWLEFEVLPLGDTRSLLRQTAEFHPRGLLGYVYWYSLYVVHALMFKGMLDRIARRAETTPGLRAAPGA